MHGTCNFNCIQLLKGKNVPSLNVSAKKNQLRNNGNLNVPRVVRLLKINNLIISILINSAYKIMRVTLTPTFSKG